MTTQGGDDLFFNALVNGYVEKNPRFLRRDWLAKQLNEKLQEPGKRFVLLTAEPGAGKSAFMAQLAHDHSDWLRYFIRRDQREVLADVSDKSVLLRIGYQLAARHPELFSQEQVRVSVTQRIGRVADGGEAVGAEVKRLIASPFYRKILEIEQHVQADQGKVVGLRVEELVIETRLLPAEDLLHLALIDPAQALARLDPGKQLVILVDALDEIRYHHTAENILAWLTNCPDLPENICFVLTSRPPDEALYLFCEKQASRLTQLPIAESDPDVQRDIRQFVTDWVHEPAVVQAIEEVGGNPETFATNATAKAHGNLGYVDALARGVDRAITDMGGIEAASRERGRKTLEALLSLKELPADQSGLYAFFLNQIKTSVARERIEQQDPETGEPYDKAVWPTVYAPMLGVLAVAMEPVDLDLLMRLGNIRAERAAVSDALDRLRQFLDHIDRRYRLYHATVAEFLTADKTRANPDTTALYQDPVKRHRQIADHYWQYRNDWSKCDGYGLRNLASHLDLAGEVVSLHELITDAWMQARVLGEGYRYSGFIADLKLAWERARIAAARQIETHDAEFAAFATCFRYALIRTSVNSLSSNYPPALVTRAIDTKLWSIERALDVCAQMSDPSQRVELYLAVLKAEPSALSDVQRESTLQAALASATAIEDEGTRAEAITTLAPWLHGGQIKAAFSAATEVTDEWGRALALTTFAIRLRGGEKSKALKTAGAAAMAIGNGWLRGCALMGLIPQLVGTEKTKVLKEALTTFRSIENGKEPLAALVQYLSGAEKTNTLNKAVTIARAIKHDLVRYHAFKGLMLIPQLLRVKNCNLLKEALASARVTKYAQQRVNILTDLMPHLPKSKQTKVLKEALVAATAIEDDIDIAQALTALAAQLPDVEKISVLNQALTAARRIKNEARRAEALIVLSPQLHGTEKTNVLNEGRTDAMARRYHIDHAELLVAQLPDSEKAAVLSQALTAARAIKDDQLRAEALIALAPQLRGEEKTNVLKEVLTAASGEFAEKERAEALILLASQLCGKEKTKVLKKAITTARAIYCFRPQALAALVPLLTKGEQVNVLKEALAAARVIKDHGLRAEALITLAPQLRDKEKTEVLKEAFSAASSIVDSTERLNILSKLVTPIHQRAWLRELRHCLLECVERGLEYEARSKLLHSIFTKDAVRPPIMGTATIAAIAQHIMEIDERWHWV